MQKNNDIACVILAGGFGTRLAPLTDIKPKPLVSILDTPVLESILGAVEDLKPSSITVSAHFHSEQIEKLCKDNHRNVVCKKENIPLGTAGGVKFCYDGKSENVLVVSGDAVFDFSLSDAVDFHIKNNSDVTIVACRNENPTRYGTIETDSENNVVAFCEKPSWKKVRSSLVNTGIYLLSRRVLFEIPDNMAYDFSNNLFPRLLRERADIKVFEAEGFWCDVGCFSEYASCNKYAADGLLACIPNKVLMLKLY